MNMHPRHLDKYELRELLGRGGMAEVWKAYDSQLQRYVAIKLLHMDLQNDPDFLTRFVREARVIASLHHPNIVQVYDFQTTTSPENAQPVAYMVMEFIDGLTLAEYIRRSSRQGRYPSGEELVQIFAAISRAIDYAHARGMVHRDIKPANILLDRRNTAHLADGEPILTDFGIARLLGTSTGTLSHTWMGTPLYLSPEQAQGQSGSEQSDIYSLGVILYEMCTGTQPFHGETVPAIILQQISAMPTSPELLNPQITPALSAVILRCLAKDPIRRFHNASSLTVALAEALGQRAPTDISQEATAIQPDPWNQSVTYSSMNMQANGTPPAARQMPPSWPTDMSAGPTVPAQTPVNAYPPPGPNPTPPQIQGLTPYITPIQAGPSNLPETPSEPSLKRLPDQNWLSGLKHFARTRPRLLFPYALAGLILLLLVSGLGSVYWFTRPHVQLDVPPGTPNLVNPRIALVALLEFDPTKQAPPGYLYHINVHLNGVLNSPGATPEQARLAAQIDNDLNNVKGWLQQVRLDAKQLITMPAGDLLSNNTLNILDNMETYARYAYVGKVNPSNNQIQGGVTQIYYQGQALATMGVTEYNGG